ncbi:PhaM family polyhydroxyalkanoate granule multifunctional regulatory protein [Ideonella sp. BN130291]|uniref:PhaM family polyhydroxyalkanoate granule multifunctional regulatory protein n=1 Tax=Ideonella sp. BN130291 TaxID=3112940 RepID=UPI002E26C5FD|nr:PhaM family polyhydroxyalkanoate granule multifunctional regulatory protein [Ideonella sp. BN130291]
MADMPSFTKLVPGFDFLQGLVKNAGAALPNIGQWVAPTLNPEELEKRIEELRTVQFWLEQNARMLGATIQALEVQRMTLSTLKTMNVQMEDLRDSLKIKLPTDGGAAAAPTPAPTPAPSPAAAEAARKPAKKAAAPAAATPGNAVDPMQWWGALTKQFTQLATNAMKDTATDAAKNLATTMVKQSFDAASQTLKSAVTAPAKAAAKAAGGAAKGAAKSAAKRAASKRNTAR